MPETCDKVGIALGYYKHLQEQKIIKFNDIEAIKSPNVFRSYITHNDLNRMRQLKQISHSVYEELFKEV